MDPADKDTLPTKNRLLHQIILTSNFGRIFFTVLLIALVAGTGTGYYLASTGKNSSMLIPEANKNPSTPHEDTKTFRDFAEGTIKPRPESANSEEYVEGTHYLIRDSATPVALTSSVVDLSKYENKRVKVFGETQKAVKEGWLMDVGKVEEK